MYLTEVNYSTEVHSSCKIDAFQPGCRVFPRDTLEAFRHTTCTSILLRNVAPAFLERQSRFNFASPTNTPPSYAVRRAYPRCQHTSVKDNFGPPVTRFPAPFPPDTWSGQPPGCTPSSCHREPSHPPLSPSPTAACQWALPIDGCPTTSFARQSTPTRTGYLLRQNVLPGLDLREFSAGLEDVTIHSDLRVKRGWGGRLGDFFVSTIVDQLVVSQQARLLQHTSKENAWRRLSLSPGRATAVPTHH